MASDQEMSSPPPLEPEPSASKNVSVGAAPAPVAAAAPSGLDEETALQSLAENVRDQHDLEQEMSMQAHRAMVEAEDRKDQKRIDKAEASRVRLEKQKLEQQRALQSAVGPAFRLARIRQEIARCDAEIRLCDSDIADCKARMAKRHQGEGAHQDAEGGDAAHGTGTVSSTGSAAAGRLPGESQREFLIRTGKITPFAKVGGPRPDGVGGTLAEAVLDAEDDAVAEELEHQSHLGPRSHQNLRRPGFADGQEVGLSTSHVEAEFSLRPRKKRNVQTVADDDDDDDYMPDVTVKAEDGGEESDDVHLTSIEPARKRKRGLKKADDGGKIDLSGVDDGNEGIYQQRLDDWVERRSRARRHRQERLGQSVDVDDDGVEEWFKPSPDQPDHLFENGLRVPGDIHPSLYDYQKTCVQWLAELYAQQVGGIVGDEMGLGKTVQLISFVASLHYSKMLDKPVIIVAPATVLRQWVDEFHRWWPPLRVSILHASGSGMINVWNEGEMEDEFDDDKYDWEREKRKPKASNKAARKIVDRVVKHGHVLVTTYAGLKTYGDVLIPVDWGYAVLDEGHKIRNPNASFTVYCKELRTANRIILSGTPIQNNLVELWSLFDFVYPMRLGTLINFRTQFEIPIRQGGYANATNLQVMTAQKCAETLKEMIMPYHLQRLKADVAADLPRKSEKVMFLKLSRAQRTAYELFLQSNEVADIIKQTRQSLYGIDCMRKICNHPDLTDPELRTRPDYEWGSPEKSTKMQVVASMLPMWKQLGYKALLFCQGIQMLDIIEAFIRKQDDIHYLRMDGRTPVTQRQVLVDRFNTDPSLNVFLLTTKVGGLGVNLTGANRVIIFDPDWNPSTDVQARERAWRLGQKREVKIYRLVMAGTIEEKMYQRQMFKQYIANKVLKDPKQQATFNFSDMHDLFTLNSYEDGKTETSELVRARNNKGSSKREPALGPKELIMPAGTGYLGRPLTKFQMFSQVEVEAKLAKRKKLAAASSRDEKASSGEKNKQDHPAETLSASDKLSTATAAPVLAETSRPAQSTAGATDQNRPGNPDLDDGLQGIAGVVGLEAYQDKPPSEEDRFLEGLFKRSGAVQSAHEHDELMNGNPARKVQADPLTLRQEANRVAARAAASLRGWGEQARAVPVGTVTWTGEVGEAGRPSSSNRGRPGAAGRRAGGGGGGGDVGPRSASILAGVASRQGLGGGSGAGGLGSGSRRSSNRSSRVGTPVRGAVLAAEAGATSAVLAAKDFETMIPPFIRRHGGQVPSKLLVDHFNQYCKEDWQAAHFKAALERVAEIKSKGSSLRVIWKLRDGLK